ncbi:hypothetical protein AB0K43_23385 [Kitasatospora sp. NPDC049258]|uniref:hypothetical protein n=1 Tax=Kitasatospora sp. NPDC049258 TaxID=3155394 RepID=UPI003419C7D4
MEGTQPPEQPGTGSPRKGLAGRRWLRGRPARWAVAGAAAVVVVGGGAAAVAVHHEGEGHDRRAVASDDGRQDGPDGRSRKGHDGGHEGGGHEGGGRGGQQATPAPLPALDAADAVVKASSGVAGGKVESLTPVTEQGGGRAWRAVVLGPDGVRHLVTVDGATDTITGNTVLGG